MVHTAVAYARQQDRLQTWACTASVGPGSTNMLTGAALATINRLPVLLLPSGTFATRASAPVLQELEAAARRRRHRQRRLPAAVALLRPRSTGPSSCPRALLGAMRVLTDPAETGAVTIALPQDVQAEAHDWPVELFAERIWHVARPPAERSPDRGGRRDRSASRAAPADRRRRRRALLRRRGGAARRSCEATGIPVGETQAGKGSLPHGHPQAMGAVGSTGTTAANALAARGRRRHRHRHPLQRLHHRLAHRLPATPGVRFVNINVAAFDAGKHVGPVRGRATPARRSPRWPRRSRAGCRRRGLPRPSRLGCGQEWDAQVEAAYHPPAEVTDALAPGCSPRAQVLGLVNELSDPRDVVSARPARCPATCTSCGGCATARATTSSTATPAWATRSPAASGSGWPTPTRDVFAMVGDGGYLMMPTELVTAVQERRQGHRRPGAEPRLPLDRLAVGVAGLAAVRHRLPLPRRAAGRLDGERAAGRPGRQRPQPRRPRSSRSPTAAELEQAIKDGQGARRRRPVVIHVETDPLVYAPDSQSWWDVPVSQVVRRSTPPSRPTTHLRRPASSIQRPYDWRAHDPRGGTSDEQPSSIGTRPGLAGACGSPTTRSRRRMTRFLDEVVASGYNWIELGPYGYLPTDPQQLLDELGARGLKLSAGTIFEHLHQRRLVGSTGVEADRGRRPADRRRRRQARRRDPGVVARPVHRGGARGSPPHRRAVAARRPSGMNELGKAMCESYGVRAQFHPHADTHVDTEENV